MISAISAASPLRTQPAAPVSAVGPEATAHPSLQQMAQSLTQNARVWLSQYTAARSTLTCGDVHQIMDVLDATQTQMLQLLREAAKAGNSSTADWLKSNLTDIQQAEKIYSSMDEADRMHEWERQPYRMQAERESSQIGMQTAIMDSQRRWNAITQASGAYGMGYGVTPGYGMGYGATPGYGMGYGATPGCGMGYGATAGYGVPISPYAGTGPYGMGYGPPVGLYAGFYGRSPLPPLGYPTNGPLPMALSTPPSSVSAPLPMLPPASTGGCYRN